MSKYTEERERLCAHRCSDCSGIGKCDDAEPGDIAYNEWECTSCSGTGFKDGKYSSNIIINLPPRAKVEVSGQK